MAVRCSTCSNIAVAGKTTSHEILKHKTPGASRLTVSFVFQGTDLVPANTPTLDFLPSFSSTL